MSTLGAMRVDEMLSALAAKTPTPGGGAAAGATGALACALAEMVVAYSVNKKDLAAHRARLESAAGVLRAWRAEFLSLADADADAYGRLNALRKAGGGGAEMAAAVEGALSVPRACLRSARDLAALCLELAPITNTYLKSDLAIAGLLAAAAARSAEWNVRANLGQVTDGPRRDVLAGGSAALAAEAEGLSAQLAGALA
ncbi:MAG: cyclodeaminase/cyclohydrolase family protein [Phycisphaerales bacterium]|nr:cyclodeaminase/cyclohydrolase family protein [Phycisphaerales bacterium]